MFHKDVMDHWKSYGNCQWMGNLVHTTLVKLFTMLPIKPFTKWGIDFIGPIKLTSCYRGNHYVLVVTDYINKWVETKMLQSNIVTIMA